MHNTTDTNKLDKMGESTVSDEKPKRGSVTPSGDAFGIRLTNLLMPMMLLSIREWDSYGYELMERARSLGFEKMNPGTMYRALRQMEKDGDVESSWETSRGGAARRMYTITDAGRSYLDFWARSLEQYQQTMDTFFRMYTGRPLQDKKEEKK